MATCHMITKILLVWKQIAALRNAKESNFESFSLGNGYIMLVKFPICSFQTSFQTSFIQQDALEAKIHRTSQHLVHEILFWYKDILSLLQFGMLFDWPIVSRREALSSSLCDFPSEFAIQGPAY